jgi:hypothetical protein
MRWISLPVALAVMVFGASASAQIKAASNRAVQDSEGIEPGTLEMTPYAADGIVGGAPYYGAHADSPAFTGCCGRPAPVAARNLWAGFCDGHGHGHCGSKFGCGLPSLPTFQPKLVLPGCWGGGCATPACPRTGCDIGLPSLPSLPSLRCMLPSVNLRCLQFPLPRLRERDSCGQSAPAGCGCSADQPYSNDLGTPQLMPSYDVVPPTPPVVPQSASFRPLSANDLSSIR